MYEWAGEYRQLNISKGGFHFAMAAQVPRLLSALMALQAGMPLLDFSSIKGRKRQAYFQAVQTAMSRNDEPMKAIFREVLRKNGRPS